MVACRSEVVLLVLLMLFAAGAAVPAEAQDRTWVSKVRRDHPRLFFNRDYFPAVRARALGVEGRWFGKLRGYADRYPAEPKSKDWGKEASIAAFVWLVTADEQYLNKAKALLKTSVKYYRECDKINKGINWYSNTRINALAAFDWMWNVMTPEERREIGLGFLDHLSYMMTAGRAKINRRHGSDHRTGYYGFNSLKWFMGLMFHNEGIDDNRAKKFLVEGYEQYIKVPEHRRNMAGDDGGSAALTLGYAMGAYPWAEFNLFHTWKSAIGEDIAPDWPYVAYFANFIMWNMLPGKHEWGVGDSYHKDNKMPIWQLYTHMSQTMHFYCKAQPECAAMASWLRNTHCDSKWSSGFQPFTPFLLTDLEKAPPPKGPSSDLPFARYFENMGELFIRSGAKDNDTYVLFVIGGITKQHKHFDNNHFGIYHKGFLALDTGTRPEPGVHLMQYYCRTVAHNCITIKQPGEQMPRYWGMVAKGEKKEPAPNDGGQNSQIGSTLVAFETSPAFTYAAGDATKCYNSTKCRLCIRQLVFVPPVHLVVFDRVTSKSPDYEKRWLLHTVNDPLIEGKVFISQHDRGKALVHTLLPGDAVIKKVGGPGKQFMAGGRNWPLPPNAGSFYGAWKVGDSNPLFGQWRVEVYPGAPREADVFLHLIEVGGAQELQTMSPHKLIKDQNTPGVRFTAPGGRQVEVRFAVSGPPAGHIKITGGGAKINRAFTVQVRPQVGLSGAPTDRPRPARKPRKARRSSPRPASAPGAASLEKRYEKLFADAREKAQQGNFGDAAELVEKALGKAQSDAEKSLLRGWVQGFGAVEEMRRWIIEGVASGRRETVFLDIMGRPTRVKLLSADDSGVWPTLPGGKKTVPWKEIPARRFYKIAKKYAGPKGKPVPKDRAELLQTFAAACGIEH